MKPFETYEEWLKNCYIPIAGGGEDEPPADPGGGDDPPLAGPDSQPPADSGGEPSGDGGTPPMDDLRSPIPRARFDQVYGQFKGYKRFGSVKEIEEKLARLDKYETALKQYRESGQNTSNARGVPGDDAQAKAEVAREIREQMLEIMPELQNINRLDDLINHQRQSNAEAASNHLYGLLKDYNVELSEEDQDDLEDLLWAKMDDDQRQALLKGEFSVLEDVFNENMDRGILARLKPSSPAPPAPPVRHTPGGQGDRKLPEKKMTFAEAESAAFERLTSKE